MSQSTTFEFQANRSTALLNRQLLNVAPSGIHQGFNVVIDSGTINAADTIKIVNAPELTSVLVTREGVRLEETGPDPLISLLVTTADPTDPRIDIVVAQHTFSTSNNPATYAVIAGTPAPSPVPPAVPLDAVVLAEVHVAALAGSISNNQIIKSNKVHKSLNLAGGIRLDQLEEEAHPSVATIAALKAIPPEERFDGQTIIVDATFTTSGTGGVYRFDSGSSATADDLVIISPNNFALGTDGRWVLLSYFNEGTYVASVGGTTPNGDGALDVVLNRYQNSTYRNALIIIRDDLSYSGSAITISKPIKFMGTAKFGEPVGSMGPIFELLSTITFEAQPSGAGNIHTLVEFEALKVSRGAVVNGGFVVANGVRLRFKYCNVSDDGDGATVDDAWTLQGSPHIESEYSQFRTNNTASGTRLFLIDTAGNNLSWIMSRCFVFSDPGADTLIADSGGATKSLITMKDHSIWFENETGKDHRFQLDGTSLAMGVSTIMDAGTGTLEIRGSNYYSSKFLDTSYISGSLQPELIDAIRFFGGTELVIAPGTYTLEATPTTTVISEDFRTIRGSGRAATIINATIPPGGSADLFNISAEEVHFKDFRLNAIRDPASGNVFKYSAAAAESCSIENVHIDAQGGAIAFGILVVGATPAGPFFFRDIRMTASSGGNWDTAFTSHGASNFSFSENLHISGWRTSGVSMINGHVRNAFISFADATAAVAAIGLAVESGIAESCIIDAAGSAGAVAGSQGVQILNNNAMLSNVKVLGNAGATKIITIGIDLRGDDCQIHDCKVRECTDHGIELTAAAANNIVEGCWIRDCTNEAIEEAGSENGIIGNYAKGNGGAPQINVGGSSTGVANVEFA